MKKVVIVEDEGVAARRRQGRCIQPGDGGRSDRERCPDAPAQSRAENTKDI